MVRSFPPFLCDSQVSILEIQLFWCLLSHWFFCRVLQWYRMKNRTRNSCHRSMMKITLITRQLLHRFKLQRHHPFFKKKKKKKQQQQQQYQTYATHNLIYIMQHSITRDNHNEILPLHRNHKVSNTFPTSNKSFEILFFIQDTIWLSLS